MALAGCLEAAFGAAPGHHRGLRRQTALKDLVPTDQPPVVLFQEGLQAFDDVALHFHLITGAQLAHARLHPRGGFPLVLDRFVAAHVYVLGREQRDDLFQHVLEKREGAVFGVEQVREHAPFAQRLERRVEGAKLGIGRDRRGRVARDVDLRNDLDVALSRIRDHLADLVLRIEAAVRALGAGDRIAAAIAGRNAAAADPGQLRVALDLHAPALVIGEMPMEGVELLLGHRIEDLLDLIQALEVAGRIEHQAAPAETGGIVDAQRRELPLAATGEQLRERGRTVEQPGFGCGLHRCAARVRTQLIAFGAGLERGVEYEADAVLAASFADRHRRATAVAQQGGELGSNAAGGLALRMHRGGRAHRIAGAVEAVDPGRCGNQHQRAGQGLRAVRCLCVGGLGQRGEGKCQCEGQQRQRGTTGAGVHRVIPL